MKRRRLRKWFRMRQDFSFLRSLNQVDGKSKFVQGIKGMYLGFLPYTIVEGLRELGDWWAFLYEVEEYERR